MKCHWVVALRSEARPIIEQLGLKQTNRMGGFDLYESAEHRLVISGIGKVNAAAATTWLFGQGIDDEHSGDSRIWINFGIGGNQNHELGTVIRAGRIKDEGRDKSWFPQKITKQVPFQSGEILTLDQPCFDYAQKSRWILEMEAAGFISTALRFSSLEWIQSVKVISDNEKSDPKQIKPAWVSELCEQPASELIEWASILQTLANNHDRLITGVEIDWLISKYRFSETQKHQLSRLLQRAEVLKLIDDVKSLPIDELKTGKEVLLWLRRLLTDTEGTEN